MTYAPERLTLARTLAGNWKSFEDGGIPYILATPEALAASPEVQAMIAKLAAALESNDALTRKLMGQTESLNGPVIHYVFGTPMDEVADILDRAGALIADARREGWNAAIEAGAALVEGSVYTSNGGDRSLEPASPKTRGMDMHHATIAAAIRAMKETTHD